MLIGLNGQRLLTQSPAGPEKYTYSIYNAFAKVDSQNKYVIYFDRKPSEEYFKKLTLNYPNFSYRVLPQKFMWTQLHLSMDLMHNPVDLFFTPVHTMPVFRSRKLKTVGMIHGLEYQYSAEFQNPFKRYVISQPERYVCQNADKVIVPSEATRDAILKKEWVEDPNKIVIVHEGVNNGFYKRTSTEIDEIKNKYELNGVKYLIFISTIQPRKNLPKTIQAYSLALKERPELRNTKLVIVGKKGWMFEESFEAPAKYGVEKNVVYLGRISEEELPALLSGAAGFINLSLEEGFGLPLLEAMSCEVFCLVSDIPSFKEIAEDSVEYANPNDEHNIKQKIFKLFQYPEIEKVQKAKERSKIFSWESAARKTLEVFQSVVKNI